MKRRMMSKFPARALLIDISRPLEKCVESNICESLENVFAVACNTAGPARIPLASILLLSKYPEILLPLSYIKGNMLRIHGVLRDLKIRLQENISEQIPVSGCVGKGIIDVMRNYISQLNTFSQSGAQMEILILSQRTSDHIIKQIESISSLVDIQYIKRILVANISDGSKDMYSEVNLTLNNNETNSLQTENPLPISELINVQFLDGDPLGFHNLFYGWLTSDCGDSEHLHLLFPSPHQENGIINIKCDLLERILNPAQLPFNELFMLNPDAASCKSVFPSASKAAGMTVPIYQIHITSLIPVTSICESLVFGMPMIIQSTRCWKIDWDELDKNQNNFKALCHLLSTKDLALIGKLVTGIASKKTGDGGDEETPSTCLLGGTFLFLPAPNGTLLVKSIAVRELVLPFREINFDEEIQKESLETMQSSLSQIDMNAMYNPISESSGLFRCLKQQSKTVDVRHRLQKNKINKPWPNKYPGRSSSSNVNPQHGGWKGKPFLTQLE